MNGRNPTKEIIEHNRAAKAKEVVKVPDRRTTARQHPSRSRQKP